MCPLCGGDSHQLESCPKLPVSSKIEVLVERFDAQGVFYANKSHSGSAANPSSPNQPIDTWVKVTPKKRMRAVRNPNMLKTWSLNAIPPSVLGAGAASTPANPNLGPPLADFIPEGVILANPRVAGRSYLDPVVNHDPLDAFLGPVLDEEENVDLFLNLHKIEDIDMSTDSSQCKRCEDGEKVSSHAVIP